MIGRTCGGLYQRCAAATGCLHHYLRPSAAPESLPASLITRAWGTASVSSIAEVCGAEGLFSRRDTRPQQGATGRMHSPVCHSAGLSPRHASGAASQAAAAPPRLTPGPDTSADEHERLTPGRVHNLPPPPWTPTKDLRKRNFLPRRMGHLMQVLMLSVAGLTWSFAVFWRRIILPVCKLSWLFLPPVGHGMRAPRRCLKRKLLNGARQQRSSLTSTPAMCLS